MLTFTNNWLTENVLHIWINAMFLCMISILFQYIALHTDLLKYQTISVLSLFTLKHLFHFSNWRTLLFKSNRIYSLLYIYENDLCTDALHFEVEHGHNCFSCLCMPQCFLACSSVMAWWRHQMETFSALLALCAGNSPVTSPATIHRTKPSDAELWCFLWSAPE